MTAVMLWTDQADLRTYQSHVDNEIAIHVTGRIPFSGAAVNKLKYDVMSHSARLVLGRYIFFVAFSLQFFPNVTRYHHRVLNIRDYSPH